MYAACVSRYRRRYTAIRPANQRASPTRFNGSFRPGTTTSTRSASAFDEPTRTNECSATVPLAGITITA